MHNSVTNFFSQNAAGGPAQPTWDVDGRPGRRLLCLFVVMLLPLAAVTVRLVQLQVLLPGAFASGWEWTTETFESIPSRDGRILSADGTVLAEDTVHYGISMHYRWLEEPADARWLARKALSQLDRKDRRDREKIEAAQKRILAEREAMWQRLSNLSGISPAELTERRGAVQKRIERIVDSVERRRKERQAAADALAAPTINRDAPWWNKAWDAFKTALTTPPTRTTEDSVVLPEEQAYYLLIDDVPFSAAAEIETMPRMYPGLLVQTETDRVYPRRSLAAHVVGSRTLLDDDEWKKRREQFPDGDPLDYRPGDRIGNSGIERSYDRRLHGLRGQRRIVKDRRGEVIVNEVVRAPREGDDVQITLVVPLQRKLEELLDRAILPAPSEPPDSDDEQSADAEAPPVDKPASAGGSMVVIDVHTGEVLAAVSAPRYDLNLLVHPDRDEWRKVNADPRRPFFPRVTRMALPPGSVFKPLSAVALVESGRVDPLLAVECHGFFGDNPNQFRCYHSIAHGPTTLSDALCRSCNVYFFSGADAIGPQQLVGWAQRFGFGRPTGIDLPGEAPGNLPPPPSSEAGGSRRNSNWFRGETRGLAIGQGRLTVTPIQVARLMATIANDGYLVTPRLVRAGALVSEDSTVVSADRFPSVKPRRVPSLDERTLRFVREGLERVVADPHGTGYKTVRMQDIAIAGKTGTAETGGGRPDHAWFAGYVPADRPRYAFAVVLEYAGSGGKTAGPVAHDLVQALLDEGLLQSTRLTKRD